MKPVVFDTAQASYLAGYLAAGVSKTGVVATFGGGNQPPVTLFMDGFVDGVAKYNEVHGTAVRVLGWDKAKQDGAFTGDFEDINKGKALSEGFIDQGADVILPVAGQVGEGAASAALERGGVSVIWVDSDGYETLPSEFRSGDPHERAEEHAGRHGRDRRRRASTTRSRTSRTSAPSRTAASRSRRTTTSHRS